MRFACLLLLTALLLGITPSSHACLWDRDTLAMEKARFPTTVELIAGYFPRHSEPYYQWRLEQIKAIPENQWTPADFDDVGVSYDKLGKPEKAIDTMLAKLERYPEENLYETHANLGTFYIHNGELEKGVAYIGSAIEINPDAHFGREIYQKLLVEYVIQQRAEGQTLPLNENDAHGYQDEHGFAVFVLKSQGISLRSSAEMDPELERAVKGVLGMMRFGNYDSPILLEALGDLLIYGDGIEGGQRLSARAYLKASYEADDAAIAQAYREKAQNALREQLGTQFSEVEEKLKEEIAEGDAYFEKIKTDQFEWIAAGQDVDAMFIEKYYNEEPRFKESLAERINAKYSSMDPIEKGLISIGIVLLILLSLMGGGLWWFLRRRHRLAAA